MDERDETSEKAGERLITLPSRRDTSGDLRAYVRFAAVGDSASYGIGDRVQGAWRGWAALLAASMTERHDVSFCNLSRPGATAADVRHRQLEEAVRHRPHLTSLLVGFNDVVRSDWDDRLVTGHLLGSAQQLAESGSVLLTVRFHDHAELLPLPRILRRVISRRIAVLNGAYDEIHATYGGFRVDLGAMPEAYQHEFWSIDRLHPSELGHRFLANRFAVMLNQAGLPFPAPSRFRSENHPTRRENLRWMVAEGGPWVTRRARDLAPAAARQALIRARLRLAL